jgi:cyanophycinase
MIAGGESEDALRYRPVRLGAPAASALASAAAAPANVHPLVYDPAGGLGLFTHGSLDTHFSERGREGRLIRLAAETGQRFAFGVDEDTALVVERPLSAKPRMSVVGTNRVNVVALADAQTSARRGGVAVAARDVRGTSLAAGDRFDASTGAATFAPWRKPVAAAGRASVPSGVRHDVFSSTANASPSGARQNPRAFADASRAFLASANRQLTARSYEGGAAVVFRRTLASEAVGGVRGVTSYRDLRVDLRGARPASAPAAARSPRR